MTKRPSCSVNAWHSTCVLCGCCLFLWQVHAGLRELDEREKQVARNTAAGAWGTNQSWPAAVPAEELTWIKETLHSTERRHRQLLQALLKGLPAAANEVRVGVVERQQGRYLALHVRLCTHV